MGRAALPEVCLGTCAGGHIWGLARACAEKFGPCGRDPTHECSTVVLVVVVVVVVIVGVFVVAWVGAWVMLCVVVVCGVRWVGACRRRRVCVQVPLSPVAREGWAHGQCERGSGGEAARRR